MDIAEEVELTPEDYYDDAVKRLYYRVTALCFADARRYVKYDGYNEEQRKQLHMNARAGARCILREPNMGMMGCAIEDVAVPLRVQKAFVREFGRPELDIIDWQRLPIARKFKETK